MDEALDNIHKSVELFDIRLPASMGGSTSCIGKNNEGLNLGPAYSAFGMQDIELLDETPIFGNSKLLRGAIEYCPYTDGP